MTTFPENLIKKFGEQKHWSDAEVIYLLHELHKRMCEGYKNPPPKRLFAAIGLAMALADMQDNQFKLLMVLSLIWTLMLTLNRPEYDFEDDLKKVTQDIAAALSTIPEIQELQEMLTRFNNTSGRPN